MSDGWQQDGQTYLVKELAKKQVLELVQSSTIAK
jgi:hypothetical protein